MTTIYGQRGHVISGAEKLLRFYSVAISYVVRSTIGFASNSYASCFHCYAATLRWSTDEESPCL